MIKEIPTHLINDFTMYGKIPVLNWFFDNSCNEFADWNKDYINKIAHEFTNRNIESDRINEPYLGASSYILQAIKGIRLKDKKIAVIGSTTPWIESILLNNGAEDITTVEYIVPKVEHEFLKAISYIKFAVSKDQYDIIISYSSIEHSGLGRYGDDINPNGDIKAMSDIHQSLKQGGLFLLGIPVGKDTLVWNAHRIYGALRLPKLLYGFTEIEWIGLNKDYIYNCEIKMIAPQPLIIFRKLK